MQVGSTLQGASKAAWPASPWVEADDIDGYLDAVGADRPGRDFVRSLAETGVGRTDLGEDGRRLCDAVVADTDGYFDRPGVTRVQDAWLRSRAVRRLANSAHIRRLLQLAYGRPAYAFQTLNFQRGSQQPTHCDAIHFHSVPERFMCGVWIALEDIAPGSGPLLYRPGSHRLPVLTMRGAGVNHDRPNAQAYDRTYVPALAARLSAAGIPEATALLRKGEALVWAANLAHGGSPVTDPDSTRRSLVIHYFFKGCLPYTPLTSDVEGGRLAVRLPMNVRTGLVEWPRLNGRPAKPALGEIMTVAKTLMLRTVRTG